MSFWAGRPVFVTGASGLLGGWLVEALLDRGARVVALVRDWVPRSRLFEARLVDRTTIVHGELEDLPLLTRVVNEYEIDTVFHLGAQTLVDTARRSAPATFEANIRGTWNLLEAVRHAPSLVSRVVVASSDKAYGAHARLPYTEDAPLQGRFPYDVSKSCADLIALSYFHTYKTPLAITRCGNLFGGGDLNFNRLVPGTIRSALLDEAPIIRSDGTFVRDYFYVRDAVDAYLLLAERLREPGIMGEAFNFGTEQPLDVLGMVRAVLSAAGKPDLEPRVLGEASFEIREQYLDCAKARTRLGWSPRWTLDRALTETVDWYRAAIGTTVPAPTTRA